MKFKHIFVLIFLPILLSACQSSTQNHVPKEDRTQLPPNLEQAMTYLDKKWNFIQKDKFKRLSESDALVSVNFTTGLWIRNNWIRGNRNPALINYFNSIGIHNPDDVSSIILLSYHRKLNNKPLGVKYQVKEYQNYWKKISDCELSSRNSALKIYNKFKVSDPLEILMHVDTSYGSNNAVLFGCPTVDWRFDSQKDLKINATLISKYYVNSPSNIFFKVRINKMNLKNIQVLSEDRKIGDEIDIPLVNLRVQ